MSSNQSSISREQNNVPASHKHNYDVNKQRPKNRLMSEKFRKLINERRDLVKNNSLSRQKKNVPINVVDDDKLVSLMKPILPSQSKNEQPDKEAMIACSSTPLSVENLIEQNINVLSQGRSHEYADELNRLIKKITLSFTAKKNESHFIIKNGIFHGSSFNIVTDDQHVSLKVSDASNLAQNILRQHESALKSRLRRQEINLHSITFMS